MNVPIGALVIVGSFAVLQRHAPEKVALDSTYPGAVTVTRCLEPAGLRPGEEQRLGLGVGPHDLHAGGIGRSAGRPSSSSKDGWGLRSSRSSIFRNRSLTVSNVVSLVLGASIFSMFYFLSLYMQQVLGYSASQDRDRLPEHRRSRSSWLPGAAQALVAKVGVRAVLAIGMLLAAGGLVYFSQISVHGSYVGTLLPGFLLAGTGLGLSFVPVTIGAVSGVTSPGGGRRIGTHHHHTTNRRGARCRPCYPPSPCRRPRTT